MPALGHVAPHVGADLRRQPEPQGHGPFRVTLAGADEQAVRVPVEHLVAAALEPGFRPEQEVPPLPGDGVGDVRVVKTAGRRAEDPVEGVHENLDGLGGDGVAALPSGLPAREQLVENAGQDAGLAAEADAVFQGDDAVVRGIGVGHEAEGVDVEGADQARVQALEIEYPDVVVQAHPRFQHVPARLGRVHAGVPGPHRRSGMAAPAQGRQIKKVEGGDAGSHPIRGHAGEAAARDGQIHQVEPLHDLERQPSVGPGIAGEGVEILPMVAENLTDPVTHVPGHGLAFSQHLAGHRVQAVVFHAHEGAPQQIHPVQHQPAGHAGAAAAEVPLSAPDPDLTVVPAEPQRPMQTRRHPGQHRQVEIHHVPAGEHIGVELGHPRAEGVQHRRLRREPHRAFRHGSLVGIHDQHLVGAETVQRYGQQPFRPGVRLYVEGNHPRRQGYRIRGLVRGHFRIVENHVHTQAGPGLSADEAGAFDVAVDQIAHGEPHVRLEGVDAEAVQRIPQVRGVGRHGYLYPAQRLPDEAAHVTGPRPRRGSGPGARRIRGADVEARPLPGVAHQKAAAVGEASVQMDHRRSATYPIARLENESPMCGARCAPTGSTWAHGRIVTPRRHRCHTARRHASRPFGPGKAATPARRSG